MSTRVTQVLSSVASMTEAEQHEVAQGLLRQLRGRDGGRTPAERPGGTAPADASYISKTPGVMGGEACIRKSRIPVWLLVSLRRQGATEAELLSSYPDLHAADLNAAWAYYQDNRDEVEEAIASQDRED